MSDPEATQNGNGRSERESFRRTSQEGGEDAARWFEADAERDMENRNDSVMPMRETTINRHRKIRKRYKELLGTDTVMNIYYRLADEFCMSVDRIRQIIAMRK